MPRPRHKKSTSLLGLLWLSSRRGALALPASGSRSVIDQASSPYDRLESRQVEESGRPGGSSVDFLNDLDFPIIGQAASNIGSTYSSPIRRFGPVLDSPRVIRQDDGGPLIDTSEGEDALDDEDDSAASETATPLQSTPTVSVPVETTPTPVESTPAVSNPVETTPTPVESTPAVSNPVETTPTPVESTPAVSNPVETTIAEESTAIVSIPVETTSIDDSPPSSTPEAGTPAVNTPAEGTPTSGVPAGDDDDDTAADDDDTSGGDDTSDDGLPAYGAPPTDGVPVESTPTSNTPAGTTETPVSTLAPDEQEPPTDSGLPDYVPPPPSNWPPYGNYTPIANYTPQPLMPAGYQPLGGIGVNTAVPNYTLTSEYDRESLILALYQESAELNFLQQGLATFTDEQFAVAGLDAADRNLLGHMASQQTQIIDLIAHLLGREGPTGCTYSYPFQNVREYVDFGQKLTRWGESLLYGFISHLDSREAAQVLNQGVVAAKARQQMIFRQYGGLHPMPVLSGEPAIPQSWAWTLLAPYITHCDKFVPRVVWENFPKLTVLNQPSPLRLDNNAAAAAGGSRSSWNETRGDAAGTQSTDRLPLNEACGFLCGPAITHDRASPLSFPGRDVYLQWDSPGEVVGPDNNYATTTIHSAPPLYAVWVSGLNVTFTPLVDVQGNSAHTSQPDLSSSSNSTSTVEAPINGTMYIAITSAKADDISSFNLHLLNPHVLAVGVYQAG